MNVAQTKISTPQSEDGLPIPRRYWSAAAIWLALSMAVLDGAIANVALPTIAQRPRRVAGDVGLDRQRLSADDHHPAAAAGCARRPDRLQVHLHSRTRAVHARVASAARSRTASTTLIAARVFQGIGAACIMSMNAALVRATYPAKMLGRGIGYNAMVLSMSAAAGPTLAALILSVGSWPWLFLINLPIGIAAVIVGLKVAARRRAATARPSTGSRPCSARR